MFEISLVTAICIKNKHSTHSTQFVRSSLEHSLSLHSVRTHFIRLVQHKLSLLIVPCYQTR